MNENVFTNSTQTVYYEATFVYQPGDFRVVEKPFAFATLEEMILTFRREKRRRALKDRAVAGSYRLSLTDMGLRRWHANEDGFRKQHEDVGTRYSI
jgi:hypothetical protein